MPARRRPEPATGLKALERRRHLMAHLCEGAKRSWRDQSVQVRGAASEAADLGGGTSAVNCPFGRLAISGTRIPVYDAAASLAAGLAMARILAAYPSLDADKVELAAIYAEANPARGRPRSSDEFPKSSIVDGIGGFLAAGKHCNSCDALGGQFRPAPPSRHCTRATVEWPSCRCARRETPRPRTSTRTARACRLARCGKSVAVRGGQRSSHQRNREGGSWPKAEEPATIYSPLSEGLPTSFARLELFAA
jgi:uncharacterized protein (DUF433 family)